MIIKHGEKSRNVIVDKYGWDKKAKQFYDIIMDFTKDFKPDTNAVKNNDNDNDNDIDIDGLINDHGNTKRETDIDIDIDELIDMKLSESSPSQKNSEPNDDDDDDDDIIVIDGGA